jgi:glyoxylase-like metal-dependent hydrolase (beta-lactamase superfamily II)
MNLRPRSFLAPNASPMTLHGTITYVVGRSRIAIIDPGSDSPGHLDALAAVAGEADRAVIIVTHDHPDHSTGALQLAERINAALLGGHAGRGKDAKSASGTEARTGKAASPASMGSGRAARAAASGLLAEGISIDTDDGDLVVIRTPGHSPDHIALHWPDASAIFCGDLMMGGLDTAVVAAPDGDLGAYLDSLERLRSLRASVIYPAHGPPFTDPEEALNRYARHRRDRLDQVRAAIADGDRDAMSIADRIYGDSLEPDLHPFALAAVEAYLAYLRPGRV